MSKYIPLTASQKEEIRRLTQLANRRILATARAYNTGTNYVLPKEVVGDFQIYEKWQTEKSPISRSVKFETKEEYLRQLKMLRSFERERVGIKEYTRVQREKTIIAMETSLGIELPEKITKKIDKMTAPQLTHFWNTFSDKATRLGLNYSSDGVMSQTLSEYFNEDLQGLIG